MPHLVIVGEADFVMNGNIKSRNISKHAPNGQPSAFHSDKSVSREKLNVWIGLCGNGTLVGPQFSEGNLSGESYLEMLNHFVIGQLSLTYLFNFNHLWWAQSEASPSSQ